MAERRRRGGSTTATRARTLVASAKRIRLSGGAAAVKADLGLRDKWQDELWAYFDSVPEFKQAVLYTGSVASRVRLFPAAIPPGDPDGDPIPVSEPEAGIDPALAAAAVEEMAALRGELGGQAEILRLLNMNLEVAGEGFVVGRGAREEQIDQFSGRIIQEATEQSWTIHSISEVSVDGSGNTRIKIDGRGRGEILDEAKGDSIIRVWLRHARWTTRADTAFRGCMTELRILQALANERLAVSQSNLTRGVFRIPNGLLVAGAPSATTSGDATENAVLTKIQEAVTDPVDDPDSPFAIDFAYISGDREDLKNDVFGPIDLFRKRDAELREDTEQAVARLARGANLPPEKIMGHMETTFANARQIDRDEFDDYHDPRVRAMADGITVGYLRPNLLARDEGFDPAQIARIVNTFDPEDIIGMPPSEEAADQGMTLGTISEEAWRHAKGFTEDDAPDALELLIRAGLHATRIPPEIILAMLEPLAKAAGITLPTPSEALIPPSAPLVPANGTTPAATPAATTASSYQDVLLMAALDIRRELKAQGIDPKSVIDAPSFPALRALPPAPRHSDVGTRLGQIDRHLFDRAHIAGSAAMDRAIERAGARIRGNLNASNRALVANVAPHLVAAHLGPALVADAMGDRALVDGEFDRFGDQFYDWTRTAQRRALAAARGLVDVGDHDSIDEAQDQDAHDARDWLVAALVAIALDRLFSPAADTQPGEGNPSLTAPAQTIRDAMIRAGGGTATDTPGVQGLVATGDTIMGVLRDGGATVAGYVWTYGDADRPFEAHVDLDGTEFVDYSDDALANTDSFPPFPYYFPGDHYGCTCTVQPTVDGPQVDLGTPGGD